MANMTDAMFAQLAHSLRGNPADGDTGAAFPISDARDITMGARDIPAEVTLARREGQAVRFDQNCSRSACWFWEFPDGSRIYHRGSHHVPPDRCPACGNANLRGGKFAKDGTPLKEKYR